jgi:hypothetical protein
MEKSRQRLWGKGPEWHDTDSMQVGMELTQVTAVGFDRIDGEPTLHPEVAQISLGQRI